MTEQQLKRVTLGWSIIAGESVTVENIGGTYYAYGSELGCLRLYYAFRKCGDRAATEYSKNLSTFYFRLEPAV